VPGRRIKLLGKPAILDAEGRSQVVRGHKAWAVLARVMLARHPLDRSILAEELFSDSVDPLGALRWCLALLRKALNASDCLIGDPIELRLPAETEVDVRLLDDGRLDVEEMGPLLGGIEPECSPEFSTWLLVTRAQIATVIDGRVRRETIGALALQDYGRAVRLAELSVKRDVYNESAHVLLVKSLALAGKLDAALAHVEATERLFIDELGTPPSHALRSAARRAIASPPGGISPSAHVKSLLRSGTAALSAGAVDSGIENLRQAVGEAEKIADRYLLAAALLDLGKGLVHAVRGFDDEGSVLLRQCTQLAQESGYAEIAADGFKELGYVEALAGRRPEARQYLQSALEYAKQADELAGIHAVGAFNLVDWGKVDSGLEHYETSLEFARVAGNRRREIWSLGLGAWGQLAANRLDNAEAWLRECMRLTDESHWIAFRPWPMALFGETRLRQREPPCGVRATLEEAYALSCQLRDPCWEAAAARSLALTFAADGAWEAAMQWLDEAYKRCIRETDAYVGLQVEILANKVEMSRRLGQTEVAPSLSREWVALAARAHMHAHVERATVSLIQSGSA
jgi:DNA-binding SARP family transcriptional activator